MGVGKTFLCKSIINKITKIKEIPSPTFNLVLTYPYNLNNEICHCDFYRINSFDEVEELGIFEDLKKKITKFTNIPNITKMTKIKVSKIFEICLEIWKFFEICLKMAEKWTILAEKLTKNG